MGAFDRLEKGVENVVANAFSRAFRSELKPVEIATALKKSMDDEAAILSAERTVSPNTFDVSLSTADFERLNTWGEEALVKELQDIALNHARQEGYTFVGPIKVSFSTDAELSEGKVRVRSHTERGNVAPASHNTASSYPLVKVGAERYLLTGPVTIIGRGSACDIVVDDSGVSRQHLELRVTPEGVIATDLGSTNGTFVEGNRITAATLVDGNTITIGRTHIMFWNGVSE